MDGYQIFNWGLLFITFGLMIYLGYLSSKIIVDPEIKTLV